MSSSRYPTSVLSPECPMTTRLRSTPSSFEDALLLEPAPQPGVGVGGDRHPGAFVRLGDRTQHPLDARRDAGLVGSALEDAGLDAGVGDALLDIADEHVGHDLRAAHLAARTQVMEVERHVVVGVKPGCHNDIELSGRRDARDPRDVATQSDHGEVDDGIHAAGLELVEPGDGVGHPLFFIAPGFRVVLGDLGGHDEYVLVHECDAKLGGIDRSAYGA